MFTPTVVLASSDHSLIASVEEISSSIKNLRLEIVSNIEKACAHLDQQFVLLVIAHMDESQPPTEVSRFLEKVARIKSSVLTLVISDQSSPEQELTILKLGVVDYLVRPLDLGRLAYLIDVLTLRARRDAPGPSPISRQSQSPDPCSRLNEQQSFIPAPPPQVGQLMDKIRRIAPRDTTILLGGETGTGKSRLAGLIHHLSPRRGDPFLTVNCGALSANLIESEMFGHQKGAFTGADTDRVGKFAAVGRGTLFLDEIDSLTPDIQAKLLRAVEERVFEPVGSNKSRPMQARLIAASNRSLREEMAAGRFRADLYYRVSVCELIVPALREHSWDVPRLTREFIEEIDTRSGSPIHEISSEALEALGAHHWPGNIRELRNAIECTLALCSSHIIRLDDLPSLFWSLDQTARVPSSPAISSAVSLAQTKNEVERSCITEALGRHNNNRLRTAAELGVSRMTLYNKLHKYGLF